MQKVLRYKDRDIIRVNVGGKRQGFYRSTGRNSGKPGTWFPFDGITCPAWFDKQAYCHPLLEKIGLMRYGTEENKLISEKISKRNLPKGEVANAIEVNLFLGKKEYVAAWQAAIDNFGEENIAHFR